MATTIKWGLGARDVAGAKGRMPLDPSCQPCPDCGGLECLCRPRFFAGQLLTEQDLNRLDHYIVEKHKLHNRHLFGSGVVCGLEVTCAPCDELVRVSSGYALSPCGEDIVVCKPDTVDVCALIARCRTDSEPDCRPYAGQDTCGDVIEDWILTVRYAESPSRGITPLTGAGQGCGCSCGGSCSGRSGGSCGCGCSSCSPGAAQAAGSIGTLKSPRLNRGAPPSCEPTVTCESYRYDVFRAPGKVDDPKGDQGGLAGLFGSLEGDLFARFRCCLEQLTAVFPKAPGDINAPIPAGDRQAWFNWCCQTRTALANYLSAVGGHDCEAMEQLQAVVCPDPSQPPAAFTAAIQQAAAAYGVIAFEAMLACLCSAALPPCPTPGDPRVPLALVKVRRRDCHIVSVCNWTPLRKHVLTFPTLTHWFGWIPIARMIREVMHTICCDGFNLRPGRGAVAARELDRAAVAAQPAPASSAKPLSSPLSVDLFAGLKADTSLFEALALGATNAATPTMGDLVDTTFSKRRLSVDPELDGDDRAAAVRMLAESAPLRMFGGMLGGASPLIQRVAPLVGGAARDADTRRDLAELKEMVARQSAEIEHLKTRIER